MRRGLVAETRDGLAARRLACEEKSRGDTMETSLGVPVYTLTMLEYTLTMLEYTFVGGRVRPHLCVSHYFVCVLILFVLWVGLTSN